VSASTSPTPVAGIRPGTVPTSWPSVRRNGNAPRLRGSYGDPSRYSPLAVAPARPADDGRSFGFHLGGESAAPFSRDNGR
jgi:hypothetical protein